MVKKVAIVDDEGMWLKDIERYFNYDFPDVSVTRFRSSAHLMEELGKGTNFDLITMDGNLAGEFGPDITKELVEKRPGIIVIGLSAGDLRNLFLSNGAKDYISKMDMYKDFVPTLKKYL